MRCVSLDGKDHVRLDEYPVALSSAQVGEILGISRVHAWRLITNGDIPSFRLGRLIRVPRAAIEHLLAHGTLEGYRPVVSTGDTDSTPSSEEPPPQ